MSKSFDAACVLVFVDPAGKLCLMDVTINDNTLRVIGVYAPNDHAERLDLFRRIEPLVTTSRRIVLACDRNVVIDSDIRKYQDRVLKPGCET